jgi:hypothetical protein
MKMRGIAGVSAAILTLLALSGCVGVPVSRDPVQLEVAGPAIDPPVIPLPDFYKLPQAQGESTDGGRFAQRWAMMGREDRAAASASSGAEYTPRECAAAPGSPAGWDAVIDAIVAHAAGHRVVIINESHMVTRHRETTRRLLAKLRPLGFRVLAAETFTQGFGAPAPVEALPAVAWPQMIDGTYSAEPAFGRLVRDARALGYRLAPYEVIYDPAVPASEDRFENILRRETAQARHLAEIVQGMAPNERLIIHAGYGHGSEVAFDVDGRDIEWMGARFKALTGIDPLTITQTACRSAGSAPFLAAPPATLRPGQFDIVVSHPVEVFESGRPSWRREAGDLPTPIPASLRPTTEPLVIEAFAWGEPFEAVPVDRVYVEPGEDLPLLLPPGRYRVRAVRPIMP